jgi:RNA polymerase sigma-70 factor (family 1)
LFNTPQYDEKELLLRIAVGDAGAFSTLFYWYHQELAAYVLRLTRSICLTEEIVQEAFLKVWIRRDRLSEVEDFRSWLFSICRNHTFNCLRDLARNTLQQQAWITQVLSQAHNNEEPDREYYYTLIEEAVSHLSPQQQKIYLLSRRDGLRYEDIARDLQLSRNTVKRHMSLALHAIESYVREHVLKVSPVILLLLTGL